MRIETIKVNMFYRLKRLFTRVFRKNIFIDLIAYDASSFPDIGCGGKKLSPVDILQVARETKIWLYDSKQGYKPYLIQRGLLSIRKARFIDSNDLTKEQIDLYIKKALK